ncbi:MAG: ferrous iron transport protein A [Elusimicrobia bacterium]|nr:ferrous iron transport protein A [Elusimicrobiota bacterium]
MGGERKKMEMILSNLKLNQPAKVKKITASDSVLTKKLLSMGILKGEQVVVTKKSVLGDPIEVTIRGYNLSLRKDEASQILVEV